MFLTEEDYITTSDAALAILQQSKPGNREKAEKSAIDEISGYLRERYDIKKIFTATGDARSEMIVMRTTDISLYHLVSWLPQKMGYEIRKERYERAIKWLSDVQTGKIMPGLPTLTGPDGEEDAGNPIRFGAGIKNNYDW